MGSKSRTTIKGDEVLTYIADKVTEVLNQRAVPKSVVAAAALAVSDGISETFGGQLIYFRSGHSNSSEERRLSIIADFETGNYSRGELAYKYGISLQQVYRILKVG